MRRCSVVEAKLLCVSGRVSDASVVRQCESIEHGRDNKETPLPGSDAIKDVAFAEDIFKEYTGG